MARQLGVRGRLAVLAGGVVRVAEDLDRRRPDRLRGERRLRARRLPEADHPPERLHRADRRRGRLAPQRIEHDVEAVAAGRLAQHAGEVVGAELDDLVRTERARVLEQLRVARRGDHAARAHQLGRLDPDLADDAARAEDQHGLARREPAAPLEPEPGREPGHAQADRELGFESVREVVARAGLDQRPLAVGAERLAACTRSRRASRPRARRRPPSRRRRASRSARAGTARRRRGCRSG